MAGMSKQEIVKLVNRYIGVDGGYLNGFSYRTHQEFYPEFCNLDIDPLQIMGTTRVRFLTVLEKSAPGDQAKIIRGTLKRFPPAPQEFGTRTKELHDEFVSVAARLEGCTVGSVNPDITSEVVERAIADAETLILTHGATSGVDRLHTALHGYLKAVCDDEGIVYARDATMNGLFKLLREQHPAFAHLGHRAQDIVTVMRSMVAIMDAMNPIRNMASVAHPNDQLLDTPEALLVINAARTILHYLNAKVSDCVFR